LGYIWKKINNNPWRRGARMDGARPFLVSDLLQKTTPLEGGTIHELGYCNSA
jgi:hypothetical protein